MASRPTKSRVTRRNHMTRVGMAQRKRHKKAYFDDQAVIVVSSGVKKGLVEIAENEGRSLSWVVQEVFDIFFGLKDDTEVHMNKPVRLRRVK